MVDFIITNPILSVITITFITLFTYSHVRTGMRNCRREVYFQQLLREGNTSFEVEVLVNARYGKKC